MEEGKNEKNKDLVERKNPLYEVFSNGRKALKNKELRGKNERNKVELGSESVFREVERDVWSEDKKSCPFRIMGVAQEYQFYTGYFIWQVISEVACRIYFFSNLYKGK